MKGKYVLIFACLIILSCSDGDDVNTDRCYVSATVRDYTGLDGCGFVLELNDGTILEPVVMITCGPPPQSIMTLDDPLLGYKEDGKRVFIDYETREGASVCMTGELVKITCISDESSISNE